MDLKTEVAERLMMTFEEFERLGRKYTVVPVSTTLLADTLTPVSAYLRMRAGSTGSFLLESVEGGEHVARYSFLGRDPIATVRCNGKKTSLMRSGRVSESDKNLFDIIHEMIAGYTQPTLPGLPRFAGGLVGFIGYDAVRFIENIKDGKKTAVPVDDTILGLFTSMLAFDHLKHQIIVVVNALIQPDVPIRRQYDLAVDEVRKLIDIVRKPDTPSNAASVTRGKTIAEMSQEQFLSNVMTAKRHIVDGDIFQVVLSQKFSVDYSGDPFNAYRALRVINPSPYLYYLDMGDSALVGSSPEALVRVEDCRAETYPIAGTRPRGRTDDEDRELEQGLLGDEKERAEHVMLVDLGRNDLGKVCKPGTVVVSEFMKVVRFSHVMHIASRITGKLNDGQTCVDVLKATFPAGTVSGAPKIRAMEIIEQLEPGRRGFYAGGVGYFDFSGNMDMCIAIRTMAVKGGRAYFQAGAGIVADSDPRREFDETVNKARVIIEALKMAEEMQR